MAVTAHSPEAWPARDTWRQVYLGGAPFFNHACEPSCAIVHTLPSLIVRTRRPVRRGETLSIAYIDTQRVYAALDARRGRLQLSYGFHCRCERCLAEEKVVETHGAVEGVRSRAGGLHDGWPLACLAAAAAVVSYACYWYCLMYVDYTSTTSTMR